MTNAPVSAGLNAIDLGVFLFYMAATVALGFWVARRGKSKPRDYFLGGNTLPWYVIATSMVATNVSSEHFIANVGASYKHGIVVATGSWNSWIIYSLLIWVFLPYYLRSRIFTMPQFLEQRYNSTCRYLFAWITTVGYIFGIIAGGLYAGGLALQSMFGMDMTMGILLLAVATGAYTIYGGLVSAAWTDFMQMIVLIVGAVLVPVLGMMKAGGLVSLAQAHPEKFQVFLPPDHPLFPVTGIFTGFLSIGIWYSCTNQLIVQRCLGAKDEWHARVGVVAAGFLHTITPLFFTVPGIIAYKLYPNLEKPDSAYLVLVKDLIPSGLRGLVLAAIAAALMSTLSTVLNSTSTVLTIDFYKKLLRPDASDEAQVRFGRWSGAIVLLIGAALGWVYAQRQDQSLFVLITTVFAYIAPPFAVIFTLGLLWRRGNAVGAAATIVAGIIFSTLLHQYLFPHIALIRPYNSPHHRALACWVFSMIVMISVSLATPAPAPEKTDGIIWNPRYAKLPDVLKEKYHGIRDWRLWWLLFIGTILSLYAFLFWFQAQHR
ncbi:MAG: sodium:solute symporter family transporter [Candidatus Sumerlaeaceae bacterium]